jgi:DGQHR domain-containing protein
MALSDAQKIISTAVDCAVAEIPVNLMASHRKKTMMAVGIIKAAVLTNIHVTPRRDFLRKTGYQRELSVERINRLADDLKKRKVDIPTAVLLNLRSFKKGVHLVERDGQKYFRPNNEKLYVVDGQHRIEALNKLNSEDPARWANFELAFVCMLGADELEEMWQFYVVNSTAKSVRTDLALDLLKQQAESDQVVMESLVERGESWKVQAQTIVERLAQRPTWRGVIRFPNQQKGSTVIGSAGLVGSFKLLLATPYFGSITTDNQLKILDAYWSGIREVIPEAFNEPAAYTLQKSLGVMAMHALLVSVIEYVRSAGKSVIDAKAYADALRETLLSLEGDTAAGEIARGADFWRTGPNGAAGSYSSNAGRRVLLAKIKGLLPKVQVE